MQNYILLVCTGAMVCIDATQPLPPLCPYYYAPTLGSLGECQQLSWTVQNKITQFEICNSKFACLGAWVAYHIVGNFRGVKYSWLSNI